MCVCVVSEWRCVHVHVGAHKDQTRALGPLEGDTTFKIRLWVAASQKMWVLKTKLIYSGRAKSTLYCYALFPVSCGAIPY